MKSVIVFATKYGSAEECALILKGKMKGDVTVSNCLNVSNLSAYDNVIIGSSLYAGKMRPEMKSFCTDNLSKLKQKNIGIYICGFQKDPNDLTQIENVFPKELTGIAKSKEYFGGAINFEKMGFFEKIIMKNLTKLKESTKYVKDENIMRMAKVFNELQG